jgi:hypothetical protein
MAPAALEQKGAISLCGIVVQFLNRKAVACALLATWRCGVFLMLALVRQMWLFEKCDFPFFSMNTNLKEIYGVAGYRMLQLCMVLID